MAGGGVQVTGLTELLRALKALGLDVEDLKDAFSAISREAADRAAKHAPRGSGRLAASIRGNRAQSKAVVLAGSARVPYARVINYGWAGHNITANPFMQRADAEMQDRAIDMLEEGIDQAIRKRGLA